MKNYQFILTRQGILVKGMQRAAFFSNQLEFRRFADSSEIYHLEQLGVPTGKIELSDMPLLDKDLKITFGQWELDHSPKDWNNSNNGGDYATYTMDLFVNGELWGVLLNSSCDIKHCCEISGNIADCEPVEILGHGFSVMLSDFYSKTFQEWKDGTKFCTVEDFLNLFSKTTKSSEEDRPNRKNTLGRR